MESLEEAIQLFESGGTIAEDLVDLLKLQGELTTDLAEKNVTTEKHVKRAKRIRIVHVDAKTKHGRFEKVFSTRHMTSTTRVSGEKS